jgi:hypothetical protein
MPNRPTQPLTPEREELAHIMDRDEMARVMAEAVRAGIQAAVADPALWTAAGKAMQAHAERTTGGWLLGTMKALFSKVGLIVMAGIGIYMVGGWGALLTALKALAPGGHPP